MVVHGSFNLSAMLHSRLGLEYLGVQSQHSLSLFVFLSLSLSPSIFGDHFLCKKFSFTVC